MGICYSEQEEWEAYHKQIRQKRRNRKKKKNASIIYEQNSIYEKSFASHVQNSFREDLYLSIENMAQQSGSLLTGGSCLTIGSIVEMNEEQLKIIYQSLSKIHLNGQLHNLVQPVTLCNLRTKNFLHTHKVSYPDLPKQNQVSSCPYNSNHIIEYDIWKFIKCEPQATDSQEIDNQTNQSQHQNQQSYYIYHPFTQRFLNIKCDRVVCTEEKKPWKIISLGPRRKGGFLKIVSEEGELCMTDDRGLCTNHRKLGICSCNHISHLWELGFGEIV